MLKIIETAEKTTLKFKGSEVFVHSQEKPFAEAVDMKLSYKTSRGNYKVKSHIKARIPLKNCKVESFQDDNAVIVFFEKDISFILDIKVVNNCLECKFFGYQGAVKLNFCKNGADGVFGGGEQFGKLNLIGEKVNNFVSEHIVLKPILQKGLFNFLPYKEKAFSKIQTYAPMTTFVFAKKGLTNISAIRFKIDSYGEQSFIGENFVFLYEKVPETLIYVVENSFEEVGKTLNGHIPNKEYLPLWAYEGIILGAQGGIEVVETLVDNMLVKGVKVCGVWCQDWSGRKVTIAGKQVYWNWEVNKEMYPLLKERIKILNEKGVRFLAYINPYLIENGHIYNYCKDKGYLIRKGDNTIYHIKSTTFDAGMIDLTNPDAVRYLKETLIQKNMLDLGIDGYMADFGEYLPIDCVLHDGDAKLLHNSWPTLWAKINREAVDSHPRSKEIFFFTRSAYNSAQNYTTMMWNGDQHTDFSKDYGMGCVLPATFNLGFSGMTALHSDVGGYITFGKLARDSELMIRWMEMSVFSPLMRGHESVRPENNAQFYSANVIEHTVKLSLVHNDLKPYIIDCMQKANLGIPIMRPDFYPSNDFGKHNDIESYFFGDEIYVCPIMERGARIRKVILPEGEWVKFFDNDKFQGGKAYNFQAPLGSPLAFYRRNGKYSDLFATIDLSK